MLKGEYYTYLTMGEKQKHEKMKIFLIICMCDQDIW